MPLIFLLVFLFSIAIAPAAYAANGNFGNSDYTDIGKDSNPYLIDDEDDLIAFRDNIVNNNFNTSAHAKLTQDITLKNEWTPIGNSDTQFTGTFDGGGHTISELNVTESYTGFFRYVGQYGVVKNLTIASGDVIGDNIDYVGGIAAYNYGTVENCANSAKVSGDNNVGGIVGYNSGTVKNCANKGTVGGVISGGIVGWNTGTVQNCTNSEDIKTTGSGGYASGIVGYNYGGTVQNCTNSGTLSHGYSVGGIVGYNSGIVQNCVSYGTLNGSNSYLGGIVSYNESTGTVQNCAWLSGTASNGVGNDSSHTGVTEIDDTSNIVMTLSASISPQSVYTGETATITFSTSPASPDGVFDSTAGALRSGGVTIGFGTEGVAEAAEYDINGTITVTGLSEGETTITVKAKFYATDLSTLDNDPPSYLDAGTELTFTFNLTVSNTEQDEDDSTETETDEPESAETDEPVSETSTGGSGGGCNAGTGALALLALIPLALRRKR